MSDWSRTYWRALPSCPSAKTLIYSKTFRQILLKSSLLSQITRAVKNPSWLAWSATMLAREVFPTPRSHRALITLALAVVAALNIAVLFSLSQTMRSPAPNLSPTRLTFPPRPLPAGRPEISTPIPSPKTRQQVVLADKVGASASLRSAADSAGIGGDLVISYLRDSRNGLVLLLSGLPAGSATHVLSIDSDQSCRNCSTVSQWN